jgi:hypothetical protein
MDSTCWKDWQIAIWKDMQIAAEKTGRVLLKRLADCAEKTGRLPVE